jgi:hypothetical protein
MAQSLTRRSNALPGFCPVEDAIEAMAGAGIEARGAIFTRPEVVEFILDLVGYTSDKPLHAQRFLEPSSGGGNFLIPAVRRLLASWRRSAQGKEDFAKLLNAVRAVEIHRITYEATRSKLLTCLKREGFSAKQAEELSGAWLVQDDFLLTPMEGAFDFVTGNPPYVRQELIPDVLMAEYRALYQTIYDRADIYIPFIERCLTLLTKGGQLGFICADRWMKNRYGGPLRGLVAKQFHLKAFVDMVDTPAFQSDVIAYPAIIVLARDKSGPTRIAHRPALSTEGLSALAYALTAPSFDGASGVKEIDGIAIGSEPWILESSDQLALVRRLEADFPTLEEAKCKVGIGVATGADRAFIGKFDELDVEDDRKLPLAMTRDILTGSVAWRGFGVVNPFADAGGLVNLSKYPRLKRYLEARKDEIAGRHIAQKMPANWYRTIDRIYPDITYKPKLLIPDIKGEANIVFEPGDLYPHHNLYFITSDDWDVQALQAVLLSGIARLFITVYSTKMRGGYLRFQAQYLRRIRVPHWKDVSPNLRKELVRAAVEKDKAACNQAVFELYNLSEGERSALGGNGS